MQGRNAVGTEIEEGQKGQSSEQNNTDFFHARAMFRNKFSLSWGKRIARGLASMFLGRLRDYVIPVSNVRPAYSGYYGPNSGETNEQFNYFHTLMRFSSLNV